MKFLILGDTHGNWPLLNQTIAKAINNHPDITHIVQVGDFGYGWSYLKPFKASKGFFSDEELEIYNNAHKMWLDGNHENFDKLDADGGAWQPNWEYMSRGSVLEVDGYRMLFFGGAFSTDKAQRTQGVSWWPQESITYGQINKTLEEVEGPLDAIFSHEHPTAVPYSDCRYNNKILGKGDKDLLEQLRLKYYPDFWIFGHHHVPDNGVAYGTEWYCAPIIDTCDYMIWTGNSMWCSWKNS